MTITMAPSAGTSNIKGYLGYVNGVITTFATQEEAQAAGATGIQPNYQYGYGDGEKMGGNTSSFTPVVNRSTPVETPTATTPSTINTATTKNPSSYGLPEEKKNEIAATTTEAYNPVISAYNSRPDVQETLKKAFPGQDPFTPGAANTWLNDWWNKTGQAETADIAAKKKQAASAQADADKAAGITQSAVIANDYYLNNPDWKPSPKPITTPTRTVGWPGPVGHEGESAYMNPKPVPTNTSKLDIYLKNPELNPGWKPNKPITVPDLNNPGPVRDSIDAAVGNLQKQQPSNQSRYGNGSEVEKARGEKVRSLISANLKPKQDYAPPKMWKDPQPKSGRKYL